MTHKHHIMPRHLGGSNKPDNLVEVTVDEHARIHHSQWILGGRWQDQIAWRSLTGQIGREQARILATKLARTGSKHTLETKLKMRLAKLGRKQTAEHVKNRFRWAEGYKHSEETKKKIGHANSISLKGKPNWKKGKTKEDYPNISNSGVKKGTKLPRTAEHQRRLWESRRKNKMRSEI